MARHEAVRVPVYVAVHMTTVLCKVPRYVAAQLAVYVFQLYSTVVRIPTVPVPVQCTPK